MEFRQHILYQFNHASRRSGSIIYILFPVALTQHFPLLILYVIPNLAVAKFIQKF